MLTSVKNSQNNHLVSFGYFNKRYFPLNSPKLLNTGVFIPKIAIQMKVSEIRSRDSFGKASASEMFNEDGFSSLIDQLIEVLGLVAMLLWLG